MDGGHPRPAAPAPGRAGPPDLEIRFRPAVVGWSHARADPVLAPAGGGARRARRGGQGHAHHRAVGDALDRAARRDRLLLRAAPDEEVHAGAPAASRSVLPVARESVVPGPT